MCSIFREDEQELESDYCRIEMTIRITATVDETLLESDYCRIEIR